MLEKVLACRRDAADYLAERWARRFGAWPCVDRKYLLVGSESSGTTAVADLLFKGHRELRYLEEGEQQWVWKAYREIYQGRARLQDYARLRLFDAIKVPGFSVIIKEFLTEFPDSKVLYLIRDPRDFASSAIKTWKIKTMAEFGNIPWTNVEWLGVSSRNPVECLAMRWKVYFNAARQVKSVNFMKYETFCADKVGTISALSGQLDLVCNKERVEAVCDQQLSHSSVRAYRPSGPGAWRDSILRVEDIATIERVCGDEMQECSYELATR